MSDIHKPVNIDSSYLRNGTPMVEVGGYYIPVLPENLIVTDEVLAKNRLGIVEDSIKPGTPCLNINGRIIPLMPERLLLDSSHTTDDDRDYELSEIGGIAIWGAGNRGANRAYQLYRVDNGLPIFKDGNMLIHPYEYEGKKSDEYYFVSFYRDGYTHYYRCSKDTFYKKGTVWEVIPNSSYSKSPAPTTIDVVSWVGS